MSFQPFLSRERRLEIIARVSAKMAAERRARGDERAAVRVEEFFERIAAIVRGDELPTRTLGWVSVGLEKPAPSAQVATERPVARDFHEPRGGELWD
jgi:hypothetical protein